MAYSPFDTFFRQPFFRDTFNDPFFRDPFFRDPWGAPSLMGGPAGDGTGAGQMQMQQQQQQQQLQGSGGAGGASSSSPAGGALATSGGAPRSGSSSSALSNYFQREALFSPTLGSCDIVETPEAHVLKLDAPGLTGEDIKVQVTDGNTLTISGERKKESEERTDKLHRVERSYGRFVRSFPLPSNVDAGKISASMDHGVVQVTVPKLAQQPQQAISNIPVQSAGTSAGAGAGGAAGRQ